ncbi:hypothetical protein FQA39_LY08220 [Lamprigera yunnana]|nr:hypothetical protein FQA39_LY08220 [Lamprigera yunnana]
MASRARRILRLAAEKLQSESSSSNANDNRKIDHSINDITENVDEHHIKSSKVITYMLKLCKYAIEAHQKQFDLSNYLHMRRKKMVQKEALPPLRVTPESDITNEENEGDEDESDVSSEDDEDLSDESDED